MWVRVGFWWWTRVGMVFDGWDPSGLGILAGWGLWPIAEFQFASSLEAIFSRIPMWVLWWQWSQALSQLLNLVLLMSMAYFLLDTFQFRHHYRSPMIVNLTSVLSQRRSEVMRRQRIWVKENFSISNSGFHVTLPTKGLSQVDSNNEQWSHDPRSSAESSQNLGGSLNWRLAECDLDESKADEWLAYRLTC